MVAESILRIPLEDLKTIRIKCAKCGLVSEGPLSDHNSFIINGQCACGERVTDKSAPGSHLFQLATLVDQIIRQKPHYSVEFVLSDNGDMPT
jgi:hypothetical protein